MLAAKSTRWCTVTGATLPCSASARRASVANPAMTSFTPVHHEADWIFPGKILAWPTPFFALRSTHVLHHVVFCVYEGGRVGPSTVNGHRAPPPLGALRRGKEP